MTRKKFLAFTAKSVNMFKRLALRTFTLMALTVIGVSIVNWLVESGMANQFALARSFPEFIPMMMAAAKFTAIEMSLIWIRFAVQPKVDVQAGLDYVQCGNNPMAIVLMHFINSLVWAFRVCVFIYLIG